MGLVFGGKDRKKKSDKTEGVKMKMFHLVLTNKVTTK